VGAVHGDDGRVGVTLEAREKEASVAGDAREELVAEVAEVKDQQVVFDPFADGEHRSVMGALRGDLDGLLAAAAHAHDDVRLERGLGVVGATGWKSRREQLVQPHDGRVGQNDITKGGQRPAQGTVDPETDLERFGDGQLEHLREPGREGSPDVCVGQLASVLTRG
jgi:hypothetical protein